MFKQWGYKIEGVKHRTQGSLQLVAQVVLYVGMATEGNYNESQKQLRRLFVDKHMGQIFDDHAAEQWQVSRYCT